MTDAVKVDPPMTGECDHGYDSGLPYCPMCRRRDLSSLAREPQPVRDIDSIVFNWEQTKPNEWTATPISDWTVIITKSLGEGDWSYRVNNSGQLGFSTWQEASSAAIGNFRARVTAEVDRAHQILSSLAREPQPVAVAVAVAAEAIYREAQRLAGADADDNCPTDYDQSALNWVRNRSQQLALAALATPSPRADDVSNARETYTAAQFGKGYVELIRQAEAWGLTWGEENTPGAVLSAVLGAMGFAKALPATPPRADREAIARASQGARDRWMALPPMDRETYSIDEAIADAILKLSGERE
jgi:hypothetical protein